jgi:hypothetical protein
MSQVVATRQRPRAEVRQRRQRQTRLRLTQSLGVGYAEPVTQHPTVGIHVRIDGHDAPYSCRTSSRICAVLPSPMPLPALATEFAQR